MSNELTLTRDIKAEPTRVWAVLTDIEGAAETLSGVTRVELHTDGPYRVGTRWSETRTMMGREETQELEVTEVEALGFTRIESAVGDTRYVSTFKLDATHPGTRLTMTFTGEATEDAGALKKIVGKVLAPVGNRSARSAMESDLDDIVKAAERG